MERSPGQPREVVQVTLATDLQIMAATNACAARLQPSIVKLCTAFVRYKNAYNLPHVYACCFLPAAAFVSGPDSSGYNFSHVHEVSLAPASFNVSGVTCSNGWSGNPVANACTEPGTAYSVVGCNHDVASACQALDIANSNMERSNTTGIPGTTVAVTCNEGFTGSGSVTCSENGTFATNITCCGRLPTVDIEGDGVLTVLRSRDLLVRASTSVPAACTNESASIHFLWTVEDAGVNSNLVLDQSTREASSLRLPAGSLAVDSHVRFQVAVSVMSCGVPLCEPVSYSHVMVHCQSDPLTVSVAGGAF
eukprot:SAG31_NODE_9100_length_1334_cov_1.651822_2_plen_306_part_01